MNALHDVVSENCFRPIAAIKQVINCAGEFDARLASHAPEQARRSVAKFFASLARIDPGAPGWTEAAALERGVEHERAVGSAALVVVADFGAVVIELPIGHVAAFQTERK